MNFGEIKTEVSTFVIDVPASVTALLPNLINRSMKRLQQRHNFKVMEAKASFTTVVGTRLLGSVPPDWKEPRGNPYYVEDLGSVREMFFAQDEANAVARYGDDPDLDFGDPRLIVEDATLQQFNAYPYPDGISDYSDGEYRVVVPYWKFFTPLSADADTNWFTQNAENYIIYDSIAMAFYANEDEGRAKVWEVLAMKEYNDAINTDKARRVAEVQSFAPHLGALRPHTQE